MLISYSFLRDQLRLWDPIMYLGMFKTPWLKSAINKGELNKVQKGLAGPAEQVPVRKLGGLWHGLAIARVRYSTALPHLLLLIIFLISHVYYIFYFLLSMYGHQGNAGTLSHVISVNYRKR